MPSRSESSPQHSTSSKWPRLLPRKCDQPSSRACRRKRVRCGSGNSCLKTRQPRQAPFASPQRVRRHSSVRMESPSSCPVEESLSRLTGRAVHNVLANLEERTSLVSGVFCHRLRGQESPASKPSGLIDSVIGQELGVTPSPTAANGDGCLSEGEDEESKASYDVEPDQDSTTGSPLAAADRHQYASSFSLALHRCTSRTRPHFEESCRPAACDYSPLGCKASSQSFCLQVNSAPHRLQVNRTSAKPSLSLGEQSLHSEPSPADTIRSQQQRSSVSPILQLHKPPALSTPSETTITERMTVQTNKNRLKSPLQNTALTSDSPHSFAEAGRPTAMASVIQLKAKSPSIEATVAGPEDFEETREVHIYPLRSRLRQECLRKAWERAQSLQRHLDQMPPEVLQRIIQYLGVHDVFRVRRVNRRLLTVVDHYLLLVKRLNFSNGLPFAFLPDSLDDVALRTIISRTPEVTHLLGFYPKHIHGSFPVDLRYLGSRSPSCEGLSYSGIIEAFRSCSRLRSVELMDVELMSKLVHYLPRVKFHGMFRNRPDAWDYEYAVPLPSESTTSPPNCHLVACTTASPALTAAQFVHKAALKGALFADWFEPVSESPLSHGSPSTVYPYFFSTNATHRIFNIGLGLSPTNTTAQAFIFGQPSHLEFDQARTPLPPQLVPLEGELLPLPGSSPANEASRLSQAFPARDSASLVALAIAAALVPLQSSVDAGPPSALLGSARRLNALPSNPTTSQLPADASIGTASSSNPPNGPLVSPLPSLSNWVDLPGSINNLTKLDLVSVSISDLPRLDSIKYLHLKWVHFTSADPFLHFSAPKLQLFVMNNCIGPLRSIRFVRIFSALARAPLLVRLELVATRFVDGLIEHIFDADQSSGRCFRNLQRLVFAGNKDTTEIDVGLFLVAGQQSLTYIALQIWHAKNSLFEALTFAEVRFPRLETLILGYQDPYQSRLTASELSSLNLVDSADSLMPVCTVSNRGLSLMLQLCPRLLNLTIRHSPYISSFSYTPSDTGTPFSSLRSLTLENCPGIPVQEVERIISSEGPFVFLEMLVLRDMFLPRLQPQTPVTSQSEEEDSDWLDWRRLGLLLSLAELLCLKHFGYAPFAPTGLGLGASAREVTHINPPTGIRIAELPLKPFDVFFTLRMNTYLASLLRADGTCGRWTTAKGRIAGLLFGAASLADSLLTDDTSDPPKAAASIRRQTSSRWPDFVSQSTQTCICGYLEWDLLLRLELSNRPSHSPCPPPTSTQNSTSSPGSAQNQLGGPLAFHPFVPSSQHLALFQFLNSSEWHHSVVDSPAFKSLQNQRIVTPITGSGECFGCSTKLFTSNHDADDSPSPSARQPEVHLSHCPRTWTARDACLDTGELLFHSSRQPLVLTIHQAPNTTFSWLTTLHFEKVGITHLVLTSAYQLKNVTVENCALLAGIIIHPPSQDQLMPPPPLPALKRITIIRCPKFAIYHWLYTVTTLYPEHDENLFITYRPFGQYSTAIEAALWDHLDLAHVMVSHDYKVHESERELEEFHSRFDQLFREAMNISDILARKEFIMFNPDEDFHERIMRSEYGSGWDLTTDIPIVHEMCDLTASASGGDLSSERLLEALAEAEELSVPAKLCRRGIHLHVQYRDVHGPPSEAVDWSLPCTNGITSYLTWPYSEAYVASTHPAQDLNVWGDRCTPAAISSLLPLPPLRFSQKSRPDFYSHTTTRHPLPGPLKRSASPPLSAVKRRRTLHSEAS